VQPEVNAEDALMHVALLLKCAEEVADEITERASGIERGLIWSMVHSVEMACAVVEALLEAPAPAIDAALLPLPSPRGCAGA